MRLAEALRGIEPGNVAKVLEGGEKLEREDALLLVAEVHRAMRGAALTATKGVSEKFTTLPHSLVAVEFILVDGGGVSLFMHYPHTDLYYAPDPASDGYQIRIAVSQGEADLLRRAVADQQRRERAAKSSDASDDLANSCLKGYGETGGPRIVKFLPRARYRIANRLPQEAPIPDEISAADPRKAMDMKRTTDSGSVSLVELDVADIRESFAFDIQEHGWARTGEETGRGYGTGAGSPYFDEIKTKGKYRKTHYIDAHFAEGKWGVEQWIDLYFWRGMARGHGSGIEVRVR